MKSLKPAFFFLSSILFFGCNSSNDYAYNEKVTSIFLRQMKQIDETDRVFSDTSKIYAKGFPDSIYLSNQAENLINNSEIDLQDMAVLRPGNAATKFNKGVIEYLTAINDYGKMAKQLLQAKAVAERRKFHDQLTVKYEKLNAYPDQLLAIQQAYLQEVGLQPK